MSTGSEDKKVGNLVTCNNTAQGNRIQIAFAHIPGEGWSAGTYYLKNLFYGLRALPDANQPEIILLVQQGTDSQSYDELSPLLDRVLLRPPFKQKSFLLELIINLAGKIGLTVNRDHPLSTFLKKNGVDALFAIGVPPDNFSLPFLSWIPDFQHLHYPEFFSSQEVKRRNRSFADSAKKATKVVLSSKTAFYDFQKFAPWAIKKVAVLPFVAQIPEEVYFKDPAFVCKKYNLPERFILLPNQFWKHKNHEIVIAALHDAVQQLPELTIVCTGNTNEHRDLSYFSKLLCSISRAGIRERMILLGLVPHLDLFFLMRQSLAVLQPSLFEGWNTTVEEVKSLGKKLVVSDIPVHREQNASSAMYFKATNSRALRRVLLDVYTGSKPGPDLNMEENARNSLTTRTEQYGKLFLEIAEACASHNNTIFPQ